MSAWHHKGELLSVGSGIATYRFFPDHVMAADVSGVFRLSLSTFDIEVVELANAESKGLVCNDEHRVAVRSSLATLRFCEGPASHWAAAGQQGDLGQPDA